MDQETALPRMWLWIVLSALTVALAVLAQQQWPGTLVAVTLYKAHLLSLGGWGGYWLDRALFPYDRPHEYVDAIEDPDFNDDVQPADAQAVLSMVPGAYGSSMLRRAVIVAACLVCVGLGA